MVCHPPKLRKLQTRPSLVVLETASWPLIPVPSYPGSFYLCLVTLLFFLDIPQVLPLSSLPSVHSGSRRGKNVLVYFIEITFNRESNRLLKADGIKFLAQEFIIWYIYIKSGMPYNYFSDGTYVLYTPLEMWYIPRLFKMFKHLTSYSKSSAYFPWRTTRNSFLRVLPKCSIHI